MLLFSLDPASSALAAALAADLDVALAPHEERRFPDGEAKLRPLVDPRGADAYVLLGLHGSAAGDGPHDRLVRLLMFIAALKDHGAARVTAVVPYLCYARKDERTQAFDPLGLRCVAQWFEAAGTAQLIVLEAHNPAALQNAFRLPCVHLRAQSAFAALAAREASADVPLAVASPDPGGVKRALRWREALEAQVQRPVGFAMVDKRRSGGVLAGGHLVAGEVRGATVLLLDDLIAAGQTLARAAAALRQAGARRIVACAAHGLFVAEADTTLGEAPVDAVAVTDSVPPVPLAAASPLRRKLETVGIAPLLAEAVRGSHASWWA